MHSLKRSETVVSHRTNCYRCFRAGVACICRDIKPFETDPEIVILIHPRETKKAIGTARLVRLSILNSSLIVGEGEALDLNPKVHELIEDVSRTSVVLFPGENAIQIDSQKPAAGRPLRVFVIDGTWSEARKMIARSRILSGLPQICFRPERPSNYRIRKQPKEGFVSTLEAVHALIERTARVGLGQLPKDRAHDSLLDLFNQMVDFQIRHIQPPKNPRVKSQS